MFTTRNRELRNMVQMVRSSPSGPVEKVAFVKIGGKNSDLKGKPIILVAWKDGRESLGIR